MNITFGYVGDRLEARVHFSLPRGTPAVMRFDWGQMGPVIGPMVADWLNSALRMAVTVARSVSYSRGYLDGKAGRQPRYIHPDTLDD